MTDTETDWWQGAVIYQIYPRSFLDTTGNGVGDLPGIERRLDHVASLGVDGIWISPFVQSPMLDFGYDVSDYCAVDPMFGTMEDFQSLLAAAHDRGLKVMMDQVLSHTSDRHAWFGESRQSRDNPKADWYVWADPDPAGAPPNNWLSVFGGVAWQWEPRRGQYYLHNFLREQPDLNYHCAAVQEAVLDECRFWLEMGVDGFRLDVCAFYFHDAELRDNPPNPVRPVGAHFMFNPHGLQSHVHDICRPETPRFLERLRTLCDEYDGRVLLGELNQEDGANLHKTYTGPGRLQLAYGYWLLGAEEVTPKLLRDTAADLGHGPEDGWPAWALENHDFTRSPTRLGLEEHPESAVVLTAALATMRGALCLYQGQELGLPEAEIPFEQIQDPYGREFWPAYRGRDGARTPMPWTAESAHGGFSGAEPWLPVTRHHNAMAVDVQAAQPGSVLNRTRHFLAWRRDQPIIRKGDMAFLEAPDTVLALRRTLQGEQVTALFNLGAETVEMPLPHGAGAALEGHGFGAAVAGDHVTLPPFGAWFGGGAA